MASRRFHAQKWLLDAVMQSVGLDWDQLRMALTIAPSGFEGVGDWNVIAKTVNRFDELSPGFAAGAERRVVRAREAELRGDIVSARESWLIASIYYGMAQWPIYEANDRNSELNDLKIEAYTAYAKSAHHKIERALIPMGDQIVPGWLHLPVGVEPPYPVVIMLPGMDTFKEKLVWAYGDKILERGMAALAIDGPGQSEARLRGLKVTAANFGDAGVACVQWIDRHEALDSSRIGVFGRSFGSYAGTVLGNAISDRISGVAVGLPCHEPGFFTIFEEASPTFKSRFMFMAGYENEDRFDEFTKTLDLRNYVGSLNCPYLVVGGDLDELSPIKHTYELTRHVPGPTELVIYQNERHAPGRAPSAQFGPHWYSLMADWLAAHVRDGKAQTSSRFRFVKADGSVEEQPMP